MSVAARLGEVVAGRYRLVSLLGEGAMGAVYAAEHIGSGRAVAIKALHPDLAGSQELRRRFEREGMVHGFLQHPNVVEVHEIGVGDDGALFLAMELIRGGSLGDLLETGPLHPRRTLVIARQVLLGLGHAHQHGLVHRDLKPANIMIARVGEPGREHDQVKLLDFGMVKMLADAIGREGWEQLSRTGIACGTPAYIPPEQALGRPVDARADLYSLGVVLFEMLTGRRPFDSDDALALMRMHVSAAPPTLSGCGAGWATPALETLVARALVKAPAERYPDARAMLAAIEAAFLSIDHLPGG
jgi:serine/threonine-protein kinase